MMLNIGLGMVIVWMVANIVALALTLSALLDDYDTNKSYAVLSFNVKRMVGWINKRNAVFKSLVIINIVGVMVAVAFSYLWYAVMMTPVKKEEK